MDDVNVINPPIMKADEMILNDVDTTKSEANEYAAQVVSNQVDMNKYVRPRKTRTVIREYDKKIGRNDPCPCGALDENGKPKKYKNCCLKEGVNYNETRELSAQEMAKIKYGTKTPTSFRKTRKVA